MCSPTRPWSRRSEPTSRCCAKILATTKRRLDAGDVTPTDTAQAEARLSRGLADLNAAEVALAISKETHPGHRRCALATGCGRYRRRLSPPTLVAATETAGHENPAVLGGGLRRRTLREPPSRSRESSLLPTVTAQASASRSRDSDPSLSTFATDQASILGQIKSDL